MLKLAKIYSYVMHLSSTLLAMIALVIGAVWLWKHQYYFFSFVAILNLIALWGVPITTAIIEVKNEENHD